MPTEVTHRVRELSVQLGANMYAGRWFDPTSKAARAEADVALEAATGTVKVEVYKGNVFHLELRDVPVASAVPRQARFSAGGFRWVVLDDDDRPETVHHDEAHTPGA